MKRLSIGLIALVISALAFGGCNDSPSTPSTTADTVRTPARDTIPTLRISPDSMRLLVFATTTFRITPKNFNLPTHYSVRWLLDTDAVTTSNTDSISHRFSSAGIHTIQASLCDSLGQVIIVARTMATDTVDVSTVRSFHHIVIRFIGHHNWAGEGGAGSTIGTNGSADILNDSIYTTPGSYTIGRIALSTDAMSLDNAFYRYQNLPVVFDTLTIKQLPLTSFTSDSAVYSVIGGAVSSHVQTDFWVNESASAHFQYYGTDWNALPKPELVMKLYR